METIKREAFVAADLNWTKNIPQKDDSATTIHPMIVPPVVILPTEQHFGTPAKPVVEVDDYVLKGQLIAKAKGLVSANIHASTSGTVVAIAMRSVNFDEAKRGTCIVIEADGKDEWIDREPCRDFQQESSNALLKRISDAGVVDSDGEGLPAHISLHPKKPINTIIISACRWNNAVNSDDVALLKYAREIVIGLKIVRQILDQPKRTVIAIEAGKDDIANAIFTAIEGENLLNCEVALCEEATTGPDRQALIEKITGRQLNDDGLPLSIGCVCLSPNTLYSIYRSVCLGEPSITQLLTVNGEGFNRRQTLSVPLGTPMSFVLKQQGFDENLGLAVRVNSIHTGNLLLHDEAPVNKLVYSLWSIRSRRNVGVREHKALNFLDGLDFYDAQGAMIEPSSSAEPVLSDRQQHSESLVDGPEIEAPDIIDDIASLTEEPKEIEAINTNSLYGIDALRVENDLDQEPSQTSALSNDQEFEFDGDNLDHRIDIIDDTEPPVLEDSATNSENEKKPNTDIDQDTEKPDDDEPKQQLNSNNPADLTIRSQNIVRLQNKLKDTEDKLDHIDPNDDESAEAILLSINILIEKINAAKSLREKENAQTSDAEANNYTLRGYMGSLQERLASAQSVLSKSDRANTSTQAAIKQALIQLEARLENALDDINVD